MKTKVMATITAVLVLGMTQFARATLVNWNSIVEDEIEYYIQTDKAVYDLGENVQMLHRVTNLMNEDVTIPCSRAPEFNLWVQKDGGAIWSLIHIFKWYSPGVELAVGEPKELSCNWDMRDDNGNLVELGIYAVVGVMYNEPWNYNNHGNYIPTEVAVPITIIPEPAAILLLAMGIVGVRASKSM